MNYPGENNTNARMTEVDAHRVCQLLSESSAPYREIAIKAGVTQSQVEGIGKRLTWLHISKDYTFKTRALTALRRAKRKKYPAERWIDNQCQ